MMGGDGESIDLRPQMRHPRHFYNRAVRQRVHYVGYERRVRRGTPVRVLLETDDTSIALTAPADREAEEARQLLRWPSANLLS